MVSLLSHVYKTICFCSYELSPISFIKFSTALLMILICKSSLHIIERNPLWNAAHQEISLFQVKVTNLTLLVFRVLCLTSERL